MTEQRLLSGVAVIIVAATVRRCYKALSCGDIFSIYVTPTTVDHEEFSFSLKFHNYMYQASATKVWQKLLWGHICFYVCHCRSIMPVSDQALSIILCRHKAVPHGAKE